MSGKLPDNKKRALMDSFFNGEVDDARFELFKKYLFDLITPEIDKICGLINKLAL